MTIAGGSVLFPAYIKLEREPPIDSAVRDPIPGGGGRQAGIDIRDWKPRISVEGRKMRGHFDGKNNLQRAKPTLFTYLPRMNKLR